MPERQPDRKLDLKEAEQCTTEPLLIDVDNVGYNRLVPASSAQCSTSENR